MDPRRCVLDGHTLMAVHGALQSVSKPGAALVRHKSQHFLDTDLGPSEAAALKPEPLVCDRASRAQYVTSVCTGSLLLAAGVLRGKRATSH